MHISYNYIKASPLELVQMEWRRLHRLPGAFDSAVFGFYDYVIECGEPAELVLGRAQALMLQMVDVTLTRRRPTLQEWRALLPSWFQDACDDVAPRSRARGMNPYPFENWVADMLPQGIFPEDDGNYRFWYWWDAEITGSHSIHGAVDLEELATEAYQWMFYAAGAHVVEETD